MYMSFTEYFYCFEENKSKISSVPSYFPLKNHSFDCTSPCSSMLKEVLPFQDKVWSVCSLFACFPRMSWLFRDLCGKPTVCQSAGCLGFAGLVSEGGAWRRGRSHLDDGGWWVTEELGSDPPAAVPQLPCLRSQSGLRRAEDTCVSECCSYIMYFRKKIHVSLKYLHLTCRYQHHSHEEGHLIRLQPQRAQLLTKFKHSI